jgi:hypothetical protein
MVFYANREEANDFAGDRVREGNEYLNENLIEDLNEDLLVYCAMCKDLFTSQGKRTYHILDLIFAEDPKVYAVKKMPSLSDRRINRAGLKKKLLRELWNESAEEKIKDKTGSAKLLFPQAVLNSMEERLILVEDVEDVLEYSRRSGQRFFNTEDSSFLAGFRKKDVTYWARWTEQEDSAHIMSVYSHRMAINQ